MILKVGTLHKTVRLYIMLKFDRLVKLFLSIRGGNNHDRYALSVTTSGIEMSFSRLRPTMCHYRPSVLCMISIRRNALNLLTA